MMGVDTQDGWFHLDGCTTILTPQTHTSPPCKPRPLPVTINSTSGQPDYKRTSAILSQISSVLQYLFHDQMQCLCGDRLCGPCQSRLESCMHDIFQISVVIVIDSILLNLRTIYALASSAGILTTIARGNQQQAAGAVEHYAWFTDSSLVQN